MADRSLAPVGVAVLVATVALPIPVHTAAQGGSGLSGRIGDSSDALGRPRPARSMDHGLGATCGWRISKNRLHRSIFMPREPESSATFSR